MYLEDDNLKNTKFGYAYKRVAEKNYYPRVKEYNLKLTDIRIDHALVDETTKAIKTTEKGRGFEYTKEELKAVIRAEDKLLKEWNIKEYEIEPYFCKKECLPTTLSDELKEMLINIVIEKV